MDSPSTEKINADVAELIELFSVAVAEDLDMLAVLHAGEITEERIQQLKAVRFPENLGFRLNDERGHDACCLMADVLRVLPGTLDAATLDQLAADYSAIYINNALRAAPAESVWLDDEGLAYQRPMFQVRHWYQRYGLAVQNWRKRSDDHLVMQLQFISHLCRHSKDTENMAEIARFLDEHLLRWLMQFAQRVAARCNADFYAALCLLTAAYCERLRDLIATVIGEPRPTQEEVAERMNPRQHTEEATLQFVPGAAPSW